jgi:transcriptional regulator with XRE-family HTH domain
MRFVWFAMIITHILRYITHISIDKMRGATHNLDVKIKQATTLTPELARQLADVGERLARLRMARRLRQSDAAALAGISRRTAGMIESGAPSVAIGQVIRYLDAIAPSSTLSMLLGDKDPSVLALEVREKRQRARALSKGELERLDF